MHRTTYLTVVESPSVDAAIPPPVPCIAKVIISCRMISIARGRSQIIEVTYTRTKDDGICKEPDLVVIK